MQCYLLTLLYVSARLSRIFSMHIIYKGDAPPRSRMLSQTSPIQLCEERNEELHKEGEKTRHRLEDTNVVFQDHGALSALT